MMKKVAGFALAFVACFGIVLVVSAAGSKTLGYKEYERITVDSMGTNFTTTIKASAKSGTPTIETKVGRKMFNLVFYDSGSNTVVIKVKSSSLYDGDFYIKASKSSGKFLINW